MLHCLKLHGLLSYRTALGVPPEQDVLAAIDAAPVQDRSAMESVVKSIEKEVGVGFHCLDC